MDAVVAQSRFTNGVRTVVPPPRLRDGVSYLARSVGAGLRGIARKLTFRSPNYVPVADEPDEFGALNRPWTPDGEESIAS